MPNEKEYVKPFAQLIPLGDNDAVNASAENNGQDEDELIIIP